MIEFLKKKKGGESDMAMLQGNSYELPIKISDRCGKVVDDTMVKSGVFSFGGIEKVFGEGGEVWFDSERECWVMPLSESETMELAKSVRWQAKFLLNNGLAKGTLPKSEYVYDSIIKVDLSGVEDVGE